MSGGTTERSASIAGFAARRIGAVLPHAVGHRDLPSFAGELADWGYDDLWFGESDRYDAFVPMAIAAACEPRLRVGSAVASVYTRGPALLAQTAAGVASAAPGRVVLGVGASSPAIVTAWNGLPYERPLARVRDTVRFVRGALAGERVRPTGIEGLPAFACSAVPEDAPPIYIGALQTKMLELAAAEGDGIVLTSLGADDVVPLLGVVDAAPVQRRPRRQGGDIAAWVTAFVSDDADELAAARTIARQRFSGYLFAPAYRDYHTWLGRGPWLDAFFAAWQSGNRRGAADELPDEMMRELAIVGSADDCAARLQRYVDNGVTTLLVEVVPGIADPRRTFAALAAAGLCNRR